MSKTSHLFTVDGKLSEAIEGFVPRQAQTDMAVAVENTIKKKLHLLLKREQAQVKPLLI